MKILLTAFDPFGGETVNPAQEAVKLVADTIAGAEVVKLTVPTVFSKAMDTAARAIRDIRPTAVVCIGQAGGRAAITPERVAINMMDAQIPDNAGAMPSDTPIVPGGPAAYFSTLPIKSMVRAIRDKGLPAAVSNTAGTFVCNRLMYGVLHLAAHEFPHMRCGFIHVPYAMEQAARRQEPTFAMSVSDITRGLKAALEALAEDMRGTMGGV